ncbi:MAG: YjzC family protein [Chloroflexi bacterium]|nr:YjzC family protein [Chloroflexota bacterium]MCY3583552.1 YjzC family protein [Chloroflexota bacterium]MCY3716155.1 YjzC family protein [Chloroflexota bacterium]MDE2650973.1 YjzC family protein [Chloroflexota bacterium]MXX50559.1 YjzC family protein [Chloroflexota bacterium]
MSKLQKPGQKAERSGEYKEVGSRGGKVDKPKQYTMDKGETLPPVRSGNKLKRISPKKK